MEEEIPELPKIIFSKNFILFAVMAAMLVGGIIIGFNVGTYQANNVWQTYHDSYIKANCVCKEPYQSGFQIDGFVPQKT
jgi:hypothetical protein